MKKIAPSQAIETNDLAFVQSYQSDLNVRKIGLKRSLSNETYSVLEVYSIPEIISSGNLATVCVNLEEIWSCVITNNNILDVFLKKIIQINFCSVGQRICSPMTDNVISAQNIQVAYLNYCKIKN